MTAPKNLVDFFQIAEKLECEPRLTRTSNDQPQSVASHSWNMAMMAMTIHPYLHNDVDMGRVLELCILHDLPEAIAHDTPLHEQTPQVKEQKRINEQSAIDTINTLLQNERIEHNFNEYESRQTPESRLVKSLDTLDACLQHLCACDLSYIGTYDDNFYWKAFFSDSFAARFDYEPILRHIYNEMRERVAVRLQQELNIDYKDYTKDESQ